jgi:hypothetical protein
MCRVVKVPAGARNWFTANELCGWPDSIQYQPRQPKRRRQRRQPAASLTVSIPPLPVRAVSGGVTIL